MTCHWCGNRHGWDEACDEAAWRKMIAEFQRMVDAVGAHALTTQRAECAVREFSAAYSCLQVP